MSLAKYLNELNFTNRLFQKPDVKRPTNFEECKPIFMHLVGDLSPENLTCDGELSPARVNAKRKLYMAAWGELERIAGRTVSESEAYSYYSRS